MLLPVRPHILFGKVPPERQAVTVPIPSTRNSGSPNLLETYLLIAAGRIVEPKRIFEIGTFLGLTTRILAANFPDAEIFTLDLDAKRSGLPYPGLKGITVLEGHSMTFDFAPWEGTCDLVFVDGGHDYKTVVADTQKAFDMVQTSIVKTRPAAIVWHDCGNLQCPGVIQALEERPESIWKVDESQIAVYFTD